MSDKRSPRTSRTDLDRLSKMKDSDIDLSDIPEISPEQLAKGKARIGFMAGQIEVPDDFDRMECTKIVKMFEEDE